MTDAPRETRAVRALGTIRRDALDETRRRLDVAIERLGSVRRALDPPEDAETLRNELRDALRDLLVADEELAAWADPTRRQARDKARASE